MFPASKDEMLHLIASLGRVEVSLLLLVIVSLFFIGSRSSSKHGNVPVYGHVSVLEPTFILRARYFFAASNMIRASYKKLKDQPYILRCFQKDIMILPPKHLEEIRLMPQSKLHMMEAHRDSGIGRWIFMYPFFNSRLHADGLKKEIIPRNYHYVARSCDELNYGWKLDVPQPEGKSTDLTLKKRRLTKLESSEWTSMSLHKTVLKLVCRSSARVLVGRPACRDADWLRISEEYSMETFATAFSLMMLPAWTRPVVARFLPPRIRAQRLLRTAEGIIGQMIQQHAVAEEARAKGLESEEDDSLLKWMLEHGTPKECTAKDMAAHQCTLINAAVHTTVSTILNVIYDLCAYPEYISVLRQEIDGLAEELGGPGEITGVAMQPQRKAMQDVRLQDGTTIPAETTIAFAACEIQMDPEVWNDPSTFDPMRCYRLRQSSPEEKNHHRAGMVNAANLTFGWGSYACPGRHFAMAEVKLIVARLIYEFDFSLLPGQGRPKPLSMTGFAFPNSAAKLLMRRRRLDGDSRLE
ncbi:hypothetical protein CDD80_346 [Ophiocordyceps camponoti-rufipedis]|uniref:Cytochrome P450 n=1 Tax=Ophiocordyceps camponoti-rufipedis TaxID=2004952 RepID=A0A2C5ZKW9_9HYPO|nr:hypothetical protein CDD80_346 [Ophiocordyceps camponoti-rufipedis]